MISEVAALRLVLATLASLTVFSACSGSSPGNGSAICGDGQVDLDEECDDGNTVGGDGCGASCLLESCGNGYLDTAVGEECDDGNTVAGDGCSADCLSDETCGNGYADMEAGEARDGTDTGGQDCTDFGYEGGTLLCISDCTVSTSECRDTVTLVSGLHSPKKLVVDATNVYWTDAGSVNKVPLAGGTPVTLVSGETDPYAIAIDSTHVYWTDWVWGSVKKASLADATPVMLAYEDEPSLAIEVDSTHVYWTTSSIVCPVYGTVKKVPLDGGTPFELNRISWIPGQ